MDKQDYETKQTLTREEKYKLNIERAKARAGKSSAQSTEPAEQLLPVPQWADPARGVPNAFLRSAIFGAIRPGVRPSLKDKLMPSLGGLEVRCTGERLDQSDLDVLLCALHLCRGGVSIRTTTYQVLKALGLPDSGKNRATLYKRFDRLVKHTVEVKEGRIKYVGNLLSGVLRDEETGELVIDSNPRITRMLKGDSFTLIEWQTRQRLAGQQLAQWLHGFFDSHAKPFPVRVETIHEICGSEAKSVTDFKKKLKLALETLKDAHSAMGKKFTFDISFGLVKVSHSGTKSQRKHLANAGKKNPN